ncbi:hypothetical protein EJ03DRAFT_176101 [Teratosphaeria nubilosa]|uniref:Uncharacterized protein n=1 Tax=Teratosphaeria nubilosa TaxID=161662 RepID=A0A6G1L221_9PEZI|nr:hypothetical protein EJ03DRAFT_176101 [Teratosphaeria nubilosa]
MHRSNPSTPQRSKLIHVTNVDDMDVNMGDAKDASAIPEPPEHWTAHKLNIDGVSYYTTRTNYQNVRVIKKSGQLVWPSEIERCSLVATIRKDWANWSWVPLTEIIGPHYFGDNIEKGVYVGLARLSEYTTLEEAKRLLEKVTRGRKGLEKVLRVEDVEAALGMV